MGVRRLIGALWLMLVLSACAMIRDDIPVKIALLTSFEGRYREIGYNALYAAQLALKESGVNNVTLLPIDDGGSVSSATDRARALAKDPSVKMALVMGIYSTAPEVQQAFDRVPVLIVGHWQAKPVAENTYSLTNSGMDSEVTLPDNFVITSAEQLTPPLNGSEILALQQFPKLRGDLHSIMVVSTALLPDADFRARYLAMNQFAPEPGLTATLVYDATRLSLQSLQMQTPLSQIRYEGITGIITFDAGRYWGDAPVHVYFYGRDRKLMPVIY